ncbi:MAG: CsgG/HfaB family protein [Pseudomonadota bacterium]
MKKFSFLLTLGLMVSFFSLSMAAEKPRLGVLRFTNHTSAGWWSGSMGSELQDMLAAELASIGAFQVLERKEIDAVLGEQDLGASGRIDSQTKAKMGKIKGARYLVAGTVSAFEEQTSGGGAGISVRVFRSAVKATKRIWRLT